MPRLTHLLPGLATAAGLALVTACSSGGSGPTTAGSTTPGSTTGSATTSGGPASTATPSSTAIASCATQKVAAMTPQQRAGQLLMVGMDTHAAPGALDAVIAEHHVGNVIYLGGYTGSETVRTRSTHLQEQATDAATAGVPLLLAADQEGGEVQQIRGNGFTRIPSAARQAQMSPAELTAAATTWGKELKAVGVNVNLAPVADTVPASIGRQNQPIGRWGRQYGSQPGAVEEPVAEVSDTGRGSARREKFQRAFERYGVPGVSLLGPLLLPTQFTALSS